MKIAKTCVDTPECDLSASDAFGESENQFAIIRAVLSSRGA